MGRAPLIPELSLETNRCRLRHLEPGGWKMNDSGTVTRDVLAQQLAELEKLQREMVEKLREHDEAQEAAPVLPWLGRRSAVKSALAPRTLPPWLARRGR